MNTSEYTILLWFFIILTWAIGCLCIILDCILNKKQSIDIKFVPKKLDNIIIPNIIDEDFIITDEAVIEEPNILESSILNDYNFTLENLGDDDL